MPYSVDQLKGLVTQGGGFARSNLYKVTFPTILPGVSTSTLNLLCKNVQLPSRQLLTTPAPIGLINKNVGNGYTTPEITMIFRMLNNPFVQEYFDYWQSLVVNPVTYEVGYYRDYVQRIKIAVIKKGTSFPLYQQNLFELKSSIPSEIRNRLPTIGPLNLATGDIDINLLTEDQKSYEVELIDAYPTLVQAMELTDEMTDGIAELTVTFQYKNWHTTKLKTQEDNNTAVGLAASILDKIF